MTAWVARGIGAVFGGLSIGLLVWAYQAAHSDQLIATTAAGTFALVAVGAFAFGESRRLADETKRLADATDRASQAARDALTANLMARVEVDWQSGTKTGMPKAQVFDPMTVKNAGPGVAHDIRACVRVPVEGTVYWWSSDDPFALPPGELRAFPGARATPEDQSMRHARLFMFPDLVGEAGPGPQWATAYRDLLGQQWRNSSVKGLQRWED